MMVRKSLLVGLLALEFEQRQNLGLNVRQSCLNGSLLFLGLFEGSTSLHEETIELKQKGKIIRQRIVENLIVYNET